jgi:hypothetical protein
MKNTRAPGGMLAEQPHAKSLLISGSALMIGELTMGEFTMGELMIGESTVLEVCMGVLLEKKQLWKPKNGRPKKLYPDCLSPRQL